jgi:hypothetical protein
MVEPKTNKKDRHVKALAPAPRAVLRGDARQLWFALRNQPAKQVLASVQVNARSENELAKS